MNKEIELLVVSYGGVGTTFIMEYLSKFFKVNCHYDSDGLKHLPHPLESLKRQKNLRIIYVYGDPVTATVSLFRRGIHAKQAQKTQTTTAPLAFETSLDDYATSGVDNFQFEQHFNNWYDNTFECPIAFVRYESIFEIQKEFLSFVGLPSYCSFFPQEKKQGHRIY